MTGPLIKAIESQNYPLINKILADANTNNHPDENGDTPINTAIQMNDFRCLRMLLNNKNIASGVNIPDGTHNTALGLAINIDTTGELTYLLLQAGADVNAGHPTPLLQAVTQNKKNIIEMILAKNPVDIG